MIPAKWGQLALFTESQIAKMSGMSVAYFRRLRYQGSPAIPFVKVGTAIRYRRDDVEAFLEGLKRYG